MRNLELTVPAEKFFFGRALDLPQDAFAAVEGVVPRGRHVAPLVSAYGISSEAVGDALRASPDATDVSIVDDGPERVVARARWCTDAPPLFQSFPDETVVLSARGDSEQWVVELLLDEDDLSVVQSRWSEAALSASPRNASSGLSRRPRDVLTDKQYETLRIAVRLGYFDLPRRADLEAIADRLGVSPQATSERLRRALRAWLRLTLPQYHEELAP